MNGEVKFRAWDGDRMWENVQDLSVHTDQVLLQYIGLKDNKGKEIYIGDICVQSFCGSDEIGPITLNPTQGFMVGKHFIWKHDIKVIGNIYQNKELIKLYGTKKL